MNLKETSLLTKIIPQTYDKAIQLYPWLSGESHEWNNRTTIENAIWLIDYLSSTKRIITSEKLARSIIGLNLPLTEEEWYSLINIFEKLQPGITDCFAIKIED